VDAANGAKRDPGTMASIENIQEGSDISRSERPIVLKATFFHGTGSPPPSFNIFFFNKLGRHSIRAISWHEKCHISEL
jgi:hypothetical protein